MHHTDAPPSGRAFGAFRHRDFRLLWIGQVISHLGGWMHHTAEAWLIYQLTGSAFLVGVTGLVRMVPFILTTLYAGTVVDRVDRRKLLIWVEALNMLVVLGLGILVAGGWVTIWHIYAASLLVGAVGAFEGPTRAALMPHLVPREDLMTAISLHSLVRKGSQVIGPALGGLLIAWVGVAGGFFIHCAGYVVLLACLFAMRTTNPPTDERHAHPLRAMADGFQYVKGAPTIAMLLVLQSVFNFFAFSNQMMVVFAREVFDTGPEGLGFLQSAVGLGAVAGSIMLGAAGDIKKKSRLVLTSGLVFCLAVIAFALTPSFTFALVFLAVSGMADIAFGTAKQTVMQMLTEHRYLGRVMSLNSISQRGIGQASGFQAGTMATFIGVQWATAIGASICLTALLGSRLLFPRAWRFSDAPLPRAEEPAAPTQARAPVLHR